MGRTGPLVRQRRIILSVRLSPLEAATLDARRGSQHRSAYVRDLIRGTVTERSAKVSTIAPGFSEHTPKEEEMSPDKREVVPQVDPQHAVGTIDTKIALDSPSVTTEHPQNTPPEDPS